MRSLILLLICSFFYICLSRPSDDGVIYLEPNDSDIRKCMRPINDLETHWTCKYFKSVDFSPASAGFGYCTIAVIEGSEIRHECRTEKPPFVPNPPASVGLSRLEDVAHSKKL